MTGSEGRLIARCLVATVLSIVAAYGLAIGIVAAMDERATTGFWALAVAGVCIVATYTVVVWERSRRTVPQADLSGLREDLRGMSESSFDLLQEVIDEQTEIEAERKAKRDKR